VTLLVFGRIDTALAESELVLDPPSDSERIAATTFDEAGREVGRSFFEVDTSDSGIHHMTIELAMTEGGLNRSEATLETVRSVVTGENKWRLREQRSQATRADGVALDLLVIDHRKRRASCYSSTEENPAGRHTELPENDRVVNVPLQLLFKPLALDEVEQVRFQLVLCRSGPVLQDMVAVRGPRSERAGKDVIEVRYGPDFGDAIAFFASRLLPRFSFWFEADSGGYLGHRMPLYRKGPNVLLVRLGMEPPDLGIAKR
jgi:hypothetical protein